LTPELNLNQRMDKAGEDGVNGINVEKNSRIMTYKRMNKERAKMRKIKVKRKMRLKI